MTDGKGMWDVIAEFGRIGIIGLLIIVFLVWAVVHFQAESGTEITFAYVTYTKTATASSKMSNLVGRVGAAFIKSGLQVEIEDCNQVTVFGQRYVRGGGTVYSRSFSASVEDMYFMPAINAIRVENYAADTENYFSADEDSINFLAEGIAAFLDLKQMCREMGTD